MGTYTASKIRKTRVDRDCTDCEKTIYKGDQYLSYAPGMKTRLAKCMPCATVIIKTGPCKGGPHYNCADIREHLGIQPDLTCAK